MARAKSDPKDHGPEERGAIPALGRGGGGTKGANFCLWDHSSPQARQGDFRNLREDADTATNSARSLLVRF